MTKEELIKELDKIRCYCSHTKCQDCIFAYREYFSCIFLNTPNEWKIEMLYKNNTFRESILNNTFRESILNKFMKKE